MLYKIIEFSVKNKLLISIGVIILIFFGIYETTHLPIDAVPDITDNQVQVITQASSYGALDIERVVTFPVEQACSNIQGIKEIRSFSRFGLSLVTIVFEDDVNVYWARQQVAERISSVINDIPKDIGKPELGPITTGLGEIYQYVVKPKKGYESKYDITELRTIQDWIIRRQLMGVKGVAEISSFGGKLKQYEISIIPEQLIALNVTIDDVFKALENNNQNTGGGYIEKGPNVVFIRSEGLIEKTEDIGNIAVYRRDGSQIKIIDIAEVRIGNATRYGALCYNDEGEATGAIVMMLKGANSNEVISNIKDRIEIIKKTLPEGIEIEPFLDRTKMVNNAIGTVRNNLLEGALIVIFVLVIFLGNLRAGLIVASVIPLSMLFAVIMMNLFGVSGNLMSLGALDFGLIVDGAVIIVEAVIHKLSQKTKIPLNKDGINGLVIDTGNRMMKSAMFGQLIILMVYIPIFSLQGIEGKMFKPMAQTVSFALLGAFILSLTYIPMMSSWVLAKNSSSFNFSENMIHRLQNKYEKYLEKSFQYSKKILALTLMLLIISIIILTNLGGEFIPTLEEGDFAVDTRVLTGSNLNTTIEYTQKAAGLLKSKFPEVEKVVTKIGSGEVPTDPMPMEASDMMVILKDKSDWTSAKSFNELAEKMSSELKNIPGLSYGFQYPVQMRFNELMTGARQDVVCKLFGENLDSLSFYANKLGKLSNTIDGVESIYVEPIEGMPQMIIKYNRMQLSLFSLDIKSVNDVVNIAFAGKTTGLVYEDEKRYDLVVKLHEDYRTIESVENMLIPTPSGNQIQLRQVADVELINGPNQIQREDAKRRIVVGFNIRNRDVRSVVNELKDKVEKHIKFPTGYFIKYGGSFENLERATKRLAIVVPIALFMIFLMLYFAFGSIRLAFMIYSAIPLSAIGGICFLAMRNMPFSISAGIGFIALFGVAVLNGIVLISEFTRLKSEGNLELKELIIQGAKSRLRPVLMTALVASFGFIPMAVSNGSGAEVQRPLATVVIGGLIIATFLTLFVLPLIYFMIEKKHFKSDFSKLIILFCFLVSFQFSKTQNYISLNQAIDTALSNNLTIQNFHVQSEVKKEMIHASEIPKMEISTTLGQYNSSYFDNSFSISQAIPFPTTTYKLKQLYRSNYELSLLESELKKIELKKAVTQHYFLHYIYKKKLDLWTETDSVLSNFISKINLRYQKGEINLLEKISAEQQRNTIKAERDKIKIELEEIIHYFNYLLHSENIQYIPAQPSQNELIFAHQHSDYIALNYQKLLIDNAEKRTQFLKSKQLPEISIGGSSTTIQGVGADNVLYDKGKRFNSFNFGLSLPIFNQADKKAAKTSKQLEQIYKNDFEIKQHQIEHLEHHFQAQFQLYSDLVKRYEESDIINADKLLELGNRQMLSGEINYLEWSVVANQYIQIKQNYLEALRNMFENYCNLKYLSFEEFK